MPASGSLADFNLRHYPLPLRYSVPLMYGSTGPDTFTVIALPARSLATPAANRTQPRPFVGWRERLREIRHYTGGGQDVGSAKGTPKMSGPSRGLPKGRSQKLSPTLSVEIVRRKRCRAGDRGHRGSDRGSHRCLRRDACAAGTAREHPLRRGDDQRHRDRPTARTRCPFDERSQSPRRGCAVQCRFRRRQRHKAYPGRPSSPSPSPLYVRAGRLPVQSRPQSLLRNVARQR